MKIRYIYYGFQDVGSKVGTPVIFVKILPCGVTCDSCNEDESLSDDMTPDEIIDDIAKYSANYVSLIGGEPLFWNETKELIEKLVKIGYKVILNTNGISIIPHNYFFDRRISIILHTPCPSSRKHESFITGNLKDIGKKDDIIFFINDNEDYFYSVDICDDFIFKKHDRPQIFFYPTEHILEQKIMTLIKDDRLNVRLGVIGIGGPRSCK